MDFAFKIYLRIDALILHLPDCHLTLVWVDSQEKFVIQ